MRAFLPLALLTTAVLAVVGVRDARAQTPDAAPVLRTVTPRVVSDVEMRQLAIFDPSFNGFRVPSGKPKPSWPLPNDSPEYAERALGALMPAYSARPSDGPLARQSTQAVYAYQPRMTTNFTVQEVAGWVPGDCTIAAGPAHLVAAFNSTVSIYDKQGTRTWTSSLDGLLGATANWKGHFDPKVVFDEGTNRFYLMAIDIHPNARQSVWSLAVSITSNPNQGWYVYGQMANQWDGEGIDYEDLGFGPRAVYLTGNYISFSDWAALPPATANHSNALWVLDKTALVAGQAVTIWTYGDVIGESSQPVFLTRVAQVHNIPAGGVDGFMTAWQSVVAPPNTVRISVWGVSLPGNFPVGGPTLTRRTVDTTPPPGFTNPQQSGGPARLQADNFGAGQLGLYFRNNTLTMPLTVGSGAQSAARVVHLSVVWPTVSLAWVSDYTDGANYHFWPNVAVNSRGQFGLGYCRSGSGEFANYRFATRTADDPAFGPSIAVQAGTAYVGHPTTDLPTTLHRWGDYSGATVDPISQGFWYFGMYASNRGGENGSDFRFWCGYMPRAVYADVAHFGSEFGTTQRPWNTVSEAVNDAFPGNDLVMKAGVYTNGGLITKPMMVFADGGTVELRGP